MDELIGLIVILAISAVISVVRKLGESRQLSEQQRKMAEEVKPEDLPEATRRILYGTTDVPHPKAQAEHLRDLEHQEMQSKTAVAQAPSAARRPEVIQEQPSVGKMIIKQTMQGIPEAKKVMEMLLGEVSPGRFWQCPNCRGVLFKSGLGTKIAPGEPLANAAILGKVSCGYCGFKIASTELFGGRFDVDPRKMLSYEQAQQMRRVLEQRTDVTATILLGQLESALPELFKVRVAKPSQPAAPRPEKPPKGVKAQSAPTLKPMRRAPAKPRRLAPSSLALFSNLDEVRRGIIMSEILGPPKGLQ